MRESYQSKFSLVTQLKTLVFLCGFEIISPKLDFLNNTFTSSFCPFYRHHLGQVNVTLGGTLYYRSMVRIRGFNITGHLLHRQSFPLVHMIVTK